MNDEQLTGIRDASRMAGGEGGAQDNSKHEAEEQMRRDLLATVLDSGARERCKFRYR